MSKYCVIARLNKELEEDLMQLREQVYAIQERYYADREWPSHITIGAYEDVNIEELCQWTEEYASKCNKPSVQFSSLGVFPYNENLDTDVIFFSPCNTKELMGFYYGFHERLDESCGDIGYKYSLSYGYPVFHSTVVICHKAHFGDSMDLIRSKFKEVRGEIIALEVYEIPKKLIKRYDIKSNCY